MINPKLTALVVTMSLLGAATPAAFGQIALPDVLLVAPEANQDVDVETGRNTATNFGVQNQEAENEIEISSEANAEGKKSKASAETNVEDNVFVQNIDQNQTQNQANVINDDDVVDVTAQNAAGGLAAVNANVEDVDVEALDLAELLDLLGLAPAA